MQWKALALGATSIYLHFSIIITKRICLLERKDQIPGPGLKAYLNLVKSHVVGHDVELDCPGASVTFDPVCVEGQRVAQLVAQRQGQAKLPLFSKAIQHVEHSAAGRLVCLQEHDMSVRLTGAERGPLGIRGRENGASSWLHIAAHKQRQRKLVNVFILFTLIALLNVCAHRLCLYYALFSYSTVHPAVTDIPSYPI